MSYILDALKKAEQKKQLEEPFKTSVLFPVKCRVISRDAISSASERYAKPPYFFNKSLLRSFILFLIAFFVLIPRPGSDFTVSVPRHFSVFTETLFKPLMPDTALSTSLTPLSVASREKPVGNSRKT